MCVYMYIYIYIYVCIYMYVYNNVSQKYGAHKHFCEWYHCCEWCVTLGWLGHKGVIQGSNGVYILAPPLTRCMH